MMIFLPPLDPVPTPGAYLDRRRVAAGLTREQVADRLAAAELEGQHFTQPQAVLLRQIFRFDVDVYLQLIDLQAAGPGSGLPVPHVCTSCACSWCMACVDDTGPCAWSDADPNRCTHCAPPPAATPAPELVS